MAVSTTPPNQRATTIPDLFDSHRTAHRVFRGSRKGADLFNPFRHIPWDYEDIEATPGRPLKRKHKIFGRDWPVPEKRFILWNQFARTILTSWINILLVCVPIGLCLHLVRENAAETFAMNYIAEFPLWFLCDYALEEMEKYIGPIASDLLDIATNNTVQVILAYLLLKENKVSLLQTYPCWLHFKQHCLPSWLELSPRRIEEPCAELQPHRRPRIINPLVHCYHQSSHPDGGRAARTSNSARSSSAVTLGFSCPPLHLLHVHILPNVDPQRGIQELRQGGPTPNQPQPNFFPPCNQNFTRQCGRR